MTQPIYTIEREDNPSRERNEFAVYRVTDASRAHCGYAKTWLAADQLAAELKRAEAAHIAPIEAQGQAVAEGFAAMAEMTRRRRRKATPCTCPQCQPTTEASGVYRCRAGQEWIAYHAGIYIASGPNFLQVSDKLNNHRHTLLNRPLPDATAEEVADVLAAA